MSRYPVKAIRKGPGLMDERWLNDTCKTLQNVMGSRSIPAGSRPGRLRWLRTALPTIGATRKKKGATSLFLLVVLVSGLGVAPVHAQYWQDADLTALTGGPNANYFAPMAMAFDPVWSTMRTHYIGF